MLRRHHRTHLVIHRPVLGARTGPELGVSRCKTAPAGLEQCMTEEHRTTVSFWYRMMMGVTEMVHPNEHRKQELAAHTLLGALDCLADTMGLVVCCTTVVRLFGDRKTVALGLEPCMARDQHRTVRFQCHMMGRVNHPGCSIHRGSWDVRWRRCRVTGLVRCLW